MNLPLKIAAFLALAAIIVLAAKSILREREPETVPAKYYTVKRRNIEQSVYGSGALRCSRRAEIVSRVAGKILAEEVFVKEGDSVQASQLLCKITNDQVEKELRQAEDEYELKKLDYADAEQEYKDKKKTHDLHGTPSEKELERLNRELQRTKLALQKADEAVSLLKEKVAFLTVTSPLAGTVLKSHLKPSELNLDPEKVYPEGTPLFIVGDLASLAVYGAILESDRSKVEEGDVVMVRLANRELPAKVTLLSLIPSAVSEGARYEIQIDFDTVLPEGNPGQTVDFRIIVEKKIGVLAVPVEYVTPERGRHWVKRVAGQKVERVPIQVGISSHSFYEVTRGLKEGDTIRWDAGERP